MQVGRKNYSQRLVCNLVPRSIAFVFPYHTFFLTNQSAFARQGCLLGSEINQQALYFTRPPRSREGMARKSWVKDFMVVGTPEVSLQLSQDPFNAKGLREGEDALGCDFLTFLGSHIYFFLLNFLISLDNLILNNPKCNQDISTHFKL